MLVVDKAVLDTEVDVAVHFSHLGKQFATRISIFLNGTIKLLEDPRVRKLRGQGFEILPQVIIKLEQEEADEPTWIDVHLDCGSTERLSFLINKPQTAHTSDPRTQPGVELTAGSGVKVKPPFGETTVEGVFAAGDCAVPLKGVAWAVATGASAGSGVSFHLVDFDIKQSTGASHVADANQ